MEKGQPCKEFMVRPVYHIEGVMKEKGEAPADFVGPLDLILHLLKKNKLAIRDIPLAKILEQYLAWVEARRELDLEVAGEFITTASHLMLLKTRMLLSEEDDETKSEMEALISSLEAKARQNDLARIQGVLDEMDLAFRSGRDCFPKKPEPAFARRVYRYEHVPDDLLRAVNGWRKRQGTAAPPSLRSFRAVVRPEPYRVERKSIQMLSVLKTEGPLSFRQMIARSRSRSEVTALFLALLELCRSGKVCLAGDPEDPRVSIRAEGMAEPGLH